MSKNGDEQLDNTLERIEDAIALLDMKVGAVVEFINLLQAAVESATSAGGVAGMMARNMFPPELAPQSR